MACIKWKTAISSALCVALISFVATANEVENPGAWRIEAPAGLEQGETGELRIVFQVNEPWHLYAPSPMNEELGVTGLNISMTPTEEIRLSRPIVPRWTRDGQYQVYKGPQEVPLVIRARAAPGAETGSYDVRGYLDYQFCRPGLCLPPQRDSISIELYVE